MKGYRLEQYGAYVFADINSTEAEIEQIKSEIMQRAEQKMAEVIRRNMQIICKRSYNYNEEPCIVIGWKCPAAETGEVPDEIASVGGLIHIRHDESWAVDEEDFKRLMPDKEDEP